MFDLSKEILKKVIYDKVREINDKELSVNQLLSEIEDLKLQCLELENAIKKLSE